MIEAGDPSLIRNFYVNFAALSETVQGYSMLEPLRRCYPQFHPETIGLRRRRGRGRARPVATVEAAFAGACDGDLSVGQILDALAQLLERDRDDLAAAYLPAVRLLVREGYLHPA